jgi:hypothetical protein
MKGSKNNEGGVKNKRNEGGIKGSKEKKGELKGTKGK